MAETLIFSTGSRIISGTLTSTASISQLNLDGVTGSFVGDGSALTGVVSASHAIASDTSLLAISSVTALTASTVPYDGVADKPALISSSLQINDQLDLIGVSGSFTGTFLGNFDAPSASINVLDIDVLTTTVQGFIILGHPNKIVMQQPSFPGFNTVPSIQILGSSSPQTTIGIARFSNNNLGPDFSFNKSRSGSIGEHGIVQDGDRLGTIGWGASDGVDFGTLPVAIAAEVDDTSPGASNIGGRLRFLVAPGLGTDDLTEALRLGADLNAHLAGSTFVSGNLEVLGSSSFAATSISFFGAAATPQPDLPSSPTTAQIATLLETLGLANLT